MGFAHADSPIFFIFHSWLKLVLKSNKTLKIGLFLEVSQVTVAIVTKTKDGNLQIISTLKPFNKVLPTYINYENHL